MNEAAALKSLYLVTGSLDPTGGGARWVMKWMPALNAFAFPLRRRVRENHSLMKSARPHPPFIGRSRAVGVNAATRLVVLR